MLQQKALAKRLYGEWEGGVGGKVLPVLPSKLAASLGDAWGAKAQDLGKSINNAWFSGTGDRYNADYAAFYRDAWAARNAPTVMRTVPGGGTVRALNRDATIKMWAALDKMKAAMIAVKDAPSTWDLASDAIIEALRELPGLVPPVGGLVWLYKYGAYLGIGILAFWAYSRLPKRTP